MQTRLILKGQFRQKKLNVSKLQKMDNSDFNYRCNKIAYYSPIGERLGEE